MKTAPWLHQASEFYITKGEETTGMITGVIALNLRLLIYLSKQYLDP